MQNEYWNVFKDSPNSTCRRSNTATEIAQLLASNQAISPQQLQYRQTAVACHPPTCIKSFRQKHAHAMNSQDDPRIVYRTVNKTQQLGPRVGSVVLQVTSWNLVSFYPKKRCFPKGWQDADVQQGISKFPCPANQRSWCKRNPMMCRCLLRPVPRCDQCQIPKTVPLIFWYPLDLFGHCYLLHVCVYQVVKIYDHIKPLG